MDELLRQALIVLRGMWRYRRLGMIVAWLVGILAAIGVMFIPERYEASTRIFVNTASILKPLMTGITVTQNDEPRIATLSRQVISRPNVEKLISSVGLDADTKSKSEYEKLVDSVMKTLVIKSAGRDNLYTLSYRDTEPERAKRVVQTFASIFIESGQGGKTDDSDAARKFIDEQIAVYEKKLQEAEGRLKEFKLRYLGVTPGEGQGYFTRLSEASVQLNRAQLELREAENSRDAYRRQLAAEDAAPVQGAVSPSASSLALTDVDARLDAMRRNLDGLLQRYTENHPDVTGARRVIKELEDQRRQIVSTRPRESANAGAFLAGPRASEQIKVSLAGAEAAVASMSARVAEYSMRYNQLKSAATQMPQLEAEFAQLNRDYDVNKKNYESLVSKRESANISSDMQSVSGVADFRMIDPPRVAPTPVAPNRKLLFPLALLIAIAAGLGAAFAAREIRPAFYDGRSLSEVTGLPILGTISLILDEPKKAAEKKSLFRFATAAGGLVGIFAVGFVAISLLGTRVV